MSAFQADIHRGLLLGHGRQRTIDACLIVVATFRGMWAKGPWSRGS